MLHSLKVQNSEQKDENPVNRGTQYKVHWLLGNFNLSRSPNAFSPEVELDASGIYIEESEWAQFFHFLLRYKITPKKIHSRTLTWNLKVTQWKTKLLYKPFILKFHVRFCRHVRVRRVHHRRKPPVPNSNSENHIQETTYYHHRKICAPNWTL